MTSPERPPSVRPVDYKGEPLDAERGPGLGCFWAQLVTLGVLVVLTPLTVVWGWRVEVSIILLFATLLLLLFAGQTVIFLLRLVAADRREGRRVPLASATPTVGEIEDEAPAGDAAEDQALPESGEPPGTAAPGSDAPATLVPADDDAEPRSPDAPGVRE